MNNTTTTARARPARRALRLFGLLLVLALLMAAWAWQGLQSIDPGHLHVVVDGDEISAGTSLAGLQPGAQVLVVLAITAACLLAILIVPIVLLAVAIVALAILLLAFGLPLVAVLCVAAVLLAPLALVGLLAWWLIRALLRSNKAPPSATMAG
jgi:hypothetical protein